jgi:hypothetical protein
VSAHRHQRIREQARDEHWTRCVAEHVCLVRPWRQGAHGGHVRIDVCTCGAKRQTEINHGIRNYGRWG